MVSGSFTRELVLTVALDRAWKAAVVDSHNLVPKLVPDFVSSVELSEADCRVGTLKIVNFGEAMKEFRFIKERVEALDTEEHIIKHSIIEGGLIGLRLKCYSIEIRYEVVNNSETLANVTLEYDTIDNTLLSAEEQEGSIKGIFLMLKAIEGYLTENPTSYA
ncbi:pathogenesis-related protein 1-like [Phalaenopsis equestris]|uniref:pathogenesis-related protein 1-like n=1 Tax=Phalaenopsis equestris TaxID=78828 RepID=UPI0009E59665|nr:pathogenesis-related protein 1-like [Phalaenopsis equestris]